MSMRKWTSRRKNAGITPGPALHGPGGLMGYSGVGQRRKAEGDARVYERSDDGKFGSGPGTAKPAKKPTPTPKKPTAKKPTSAAKPAAPAPAAKVDHTASLNKLGLDPKLSDALGEYLSGINADPPEEMSLNPEAAAALEALGIIKVKPGQEGEPNKAIELTPAGQRLDKAVQAGDVAKGMQVVEAAHTGYDKREAKRVAREAKRAARLAAREAARAAKKKPVEKTMRPKRKKTYWCAYQAAKAAGFDRDKARKAARKALAGQDRATAMQTYQRSLKDGLSVYKDARGDWRWLCVSSTAYEDRDREIVSTKALRDAVAYGDRTGDRGVLRWWHIPGFDIGDCDFQATTQGDRFLIESGTFRSPQIAQKIASAVNDLGLTLGFYHPANEPSGRVFTNIVPFERSLAPRDKVSNRFTSLIVKGFPMNEEKLKAARALLGDDVVTALLANVATTDKTAQDQRVAYKAAAPDQTVYYQGDTPGVIANGTFVALKAAPMEAEVKAPMPIAEAVAAGAAELVDDGLEEVADGEVVGDMDIGAFKQLLMEVLAAAIAQQGSALSAIDEQMKGMGYARTKEAQAVTTLTEQVTAQEQRLKSLEGDLPAAQAYRASSAASTLMHADAVAAVTAKAAPAMLDLTSLMFPELNATGD